MYCVAHEEEPPNKDEEHYVEKPVVTLVEKSMRKGITRRRHVGKSTPSRSPSATADDRLTPAELNIVERFVDRADPKELETIINMCAKRLRTG